MNKAETISLLKKVEVFSGCSDRQLGTIVANMHENAKPEGAVIVRAGDPGRVFFIITQGMVKVVVNGRTRTKLGRGDSFGELSILTHEPRSATVVAETPVEYLALTSGAFKGLVEANPAFALGLLGNLARRFRELNKSITS